MSEPLRQLDNQTDATLLSSVLAALKELKFGSVEITVHNGQIVQIERREKFRLQPTSTKRD